MVAKGKKGGHLRRGSETKDTVMGKIFIQKIKIKKTQLKRCEAVYSGLKQGKKLLDRITPRTLKEKSAKQILLVKVQRKPGRRTDNSGDTRINFNLKVRKRLGRKEEPRVVKGGQKR